MLLALLLAASPICPSQGAVVVVVTSKHQMVLCDGGVEHAAYDVAIGSGGVAAGRVGWAQTPLGKFTLSLPRPSAQFHVFVPLVNPDPKRFSAWAIGIHGPPRASKDEGRVNVDSDWTWGCIAVSSDAEIDAVAAWVKAKTVTRVEFR